MPIIYRLNNFGAFFSHFANKSIVFRKLENTYFQFKILS